MKTLIYTTIISLVFLSCDDGVSNQSSEKMPVMDSRVVSYKKDVEREYDFLGRGFITDEGTLKSIFSHMFDNEQVGCNYFAIYFLSSSVPSCYWILSQDMILYNLIISLLKANFSFEIIKK